MNPGPAADKDIVRRLLLAFQFVGQRMDDLAVEEMATELAVFDKHDVLVALKRCRSELKFIKFPDILDRIPGNHPGVEEAWAIVKRVIGNEAETVVWTDEMQGAHAVADALADDLIAARLAFKEKYAHLVMESRLKKQKPTWRISLGWDARRREAVLREAVERGLIANETAQAVLPMFIPQPSSLVKS